MPGSFLRHGRPDRFELGRAGESLAARFVARRLRRREPSPVRLIGRRVRTPCGEVDLVFATARELVCVEVKTGRLRSPESGLCERWRPARRFDQRRFLRQARAARLLARTRGPAVGPRVDLVEVLVDPLSGYAHLVHHARLAAGFGRIPGAPGHPVALPRSPSAADH